jgi:hypothetical protein
VKTAALARGGQDDSEVCHALRIHDLPVPVRCGEWRC